MYIIDNYVRERFVNFMAEVWGGGGAMFFLAQGKNIAPPLIVEREFPNGGKKSI